MKGRKEFEGVMTTGHENDPKEKEEKKNRNKEKKAHQPLGHQQEFWTGAKFPPLEDEFIH